MTVRKKKGYLNIWPAAGIVLNLFVAGAAEASQQLHPRWRPAKPVSVPYRVGDDARTIIVKITDGAGAAVVDGRLAGFEGSAELEQKMRPFAPLRIDPLFTIPAARLIERRQSASVRTSNEHADLTQYFKLTLTPGTSGEAAIASLLSSPSVENAYFAPMALRAPGNAGNPQTPDFTNTQLYKDAAPAGVGAWFAIANDPAGAAIGVRVADLEYDWNLNHEDLSQKSHPAPVGPGPRPPFTDPNDLAAAQQHGTAVLGILAADNDAYGVAGIAHAGGIRTVATCTSQGESVANAVLLAMEYLQPGDIILIEQQTPGPNYDPQCTSYNSQGIQHQFGLVPVEFNDAEFDAIRIAVSNGYHVVEAAGNGAQDLDLLVSSGSCAKGDASYIKFDLKVRDSGAILAAAGTAAAPHTPTIFTNVGVRVDAYSWGEHVATLGFGDLANFDKNAVGGEINKYYTGEFGGTSAAAAIVASCAAVLESKHAILYSLPYPTAGLRLLLRTSGTNSKNPRNDRIGRQPDLKLQLQTVASVKDAAIVRTGNPGSRLGAAVAWSAQTSADGRSNILISSPFDNNSSGRVDLINAATGDIFTIWNGESAGDMFGMSVAGAGDIDGDGIGDSIVGAPGGTGRVYLYSGLSAAPMQTTSDALSGTGYGFALAGGCDLNADGICDIVIGAPQFAQNQTASGALNFLSGATGQLILQVVDAQAGDMLGYSTAILGDVNGDGVTDILVGAPGSGQSAGSARVISGKDGSVLYTYSGQVINDHFGSSVAGLGDCNGDGIADFAIGAPFNSLASPLSGRIYVYSGSGGSLLFRRSGDSGQRFGAALAAAGDVNRDYYNDIVVGAPGDPTNPNTTDPGHVYIYSGITGVKVENFTGEVAGDGFGLAIAGRADADVNAVPDLIIGAPYSNKNGADSGSAYTVFRYDHTLFGLASFGTGTPGCEGPEFVFANSNPTMANAGYAITCTNAPRSAMGVLAVGNAYDPSGSDPFGLGILFHIDFASTTEFFAFPIISNIAGFAEVSTPIPNNPQLVGNTYIAQAYWNWAPELGGLCITIPSVSALSSSNGLWMTIQPL
ncbi:MAG: FG-GAP repeat protein [Planctomycetes bacterium]|nr:FG-GAP repeat protein [Planctomycetota bacterium]